MLSLFCFRYEYIQKVFSVKKPKTKKISNLIKAIYLGNFIIFVFISFNSVYRLHYLTIII